MTEVSMPARHAQTAARGARRIAFDQLPVLDMTPMFSEDIAERRAFAQELSRICQTVGFFYLKGHRVPQEQIDALFEVGRKFFYLSEEEKMTTHTALHAVRYGGYTPLRERGGTLHSAFDMGVEFGSSEPEVRAGLIPECRNRWPASLPDFERQMTAYKAAVLEVGRRLYRAFALALDLPEDWFEPKIVKPFGTLRVNWYPPQDPSTANVDMGISAHTDYQCMTLLLQDGNDGLQVQSGDGEWIAAPPIAGTYVVNIGDMMARWTNDLFSSTPHRVINLSGRERMSIPYFYGVNFAEEVDTLPTCITSERPKKYQPILGGKHVLDRFQEAYRMNMNRPASEDAKSRITAS